MYFCCDGGCVSPLSYKDKITINNQHTEALHILTNTNSDMFINADKYIKKIINLYQQLRYLVDYIHPNAVCGVRYTLEL